MRIGSLGAWPDRGLPFPPRRAQAADQNANFATFRTVTYLPNLRVQGLQLLALPFLSQTTNTLWK